MTLTGDPVARIMRLARSVAGINLAESKRSMVEGRLGKRLRALGTDMRGYAKLLRDDARELTTCIDLLTTNHSFWMREADHYRDFAHRVIPALQTRHRAAIWCAAAATGEEPYTIAMVMQRTVGDLIGWDARILATDISTRALRHAVEGVYSHERVSHLTDADRALALAPVQVQYHGHGQRRWRVRDDLRRLVHFARLNLMDEEWPMRGPFDVIFCRNVMIYFDRPTQHRLVGRLSALLAPGGTLYVGHSESLSAHEHGLRTLAPAVHVKT